VDNEFVMPEPMVRNLGILLDSELSMNNHHRLFWRSAVDKYVATLFSFKAAVSRPLFP
jgi:hypothetical protein